MCVRFARPPAAILRNVDLTTTSSKKVRTDLEQKLNCDLVERKKEIAAVIEQYVADNVKDDQATSDSSSDDDDAPKKTATARTATKRPAADDAASSDDDSTTDYGRAAKAAPKKKKATAKKTATSDADGAKPKGKGNGFTRPFKLSPELATLMGEPELPRHEVVRKMWALIKGRNLYDPKNKQFAICDAELLTVIGVKRFRTFGMLKYLKKHFVQ